MDIVVLDISAPKNVLMAQKVLFGCFQVFFNNLALANILANATRKLGTRIFYDVFFRYIFPEKEGVYVPHP